MTNQTRNTGEVLKRREPNMDRRAFAIKYNFYVAHEPCAVCGEDIHPAVGPQLFEEDTWAYVCLDCGRRYAPELVEMLINDTWPPKKQAESRQDTCLDEQKTAELWSKLPIRYYATLIAPDYRGYKDFAFHLFHTKMPDEEISQLVVFAKDRTIQDLGYPSTHIEQTFSKSEIRQLHEYFVSQNTLGRLRIKRADPPTNNCIGYGAYPVDGLDDFYMFSKVEGYSLPFEVWGYFDLEDCERLENDLLTSTTGTKD